MGPGAKSARSLEVKITHEKFTVVRSSTGLLGLSTGLRSRTVYYASIGEVRLSERGGRFVISLFEPQGHLIMHIHSFDRTLSMRFVDALHTMRQGAEQ